MKNIRGYVTAILILIVITIIGLSVLVKFVLTGDRLQAMLVPPAEKALGRNVSIGKIDVSLFKGITIDGFSIKEADGKADFVSAGSFVLKYDLMPLLQKKIVVSEVVLKNPAITLKRDAKGNFNYSTLALLAQDKKEGKQEPAASSSAAALPLALTVQKISIADAAFKVEDAQGELPTVNGRADLEIGLDLGQDISSLRFQGNTQFDVDADYQGVKPNISGALKFSEQELSGNIAVLVQGEEINLDTVVKNYMLTAAVEMNVRSKELNIDKLIGLASSLPSAGKDGGKASAPKMKGKKESIASKLPPGLTAHGVVQIDKALHNKLVVNNFHVAYRLDKNIFFVEEFSAETAGGVVTSNMKLDLNDPDLAYDGALDIKAIQFGQVMTALFPKISENISGSLATDIAYSGRGTSWDVIKDQLSGKGDFNLSDGQIRNSKVTASIANLLGIEELKNYVFKNFSGNFRLSEGDVLLKSSIDGRDLDMVTDGKIGLDSALALPLTLKLSPEMSKRMQEKSSIAKYLSDDQGQTTLQLSIGGTLKSPKPVLDSRSVQKKVGETVKQKILSEIGDRVDKKKTDGSQQEEGKPDIEEVGKGLLKGLLGK
ncbi:MAG: AsmA family protein [Desulfobulbaceae bacterium]|nr:AsmA family protein [Desulfobulbaceae bacterium]